MKIRVVLTVEIPDSEASALTANRTGTQARDLIRDAVCVAARQADWIRDLEAEVTREN